MLSDRLAQTAGNAAFRLPSRETFPTRIKVWVSITKSVLNALTRLLPSTNSESDVWSRMVAVSRRRKAGNVWVVERRLWRVGRKQIAGTIGGWQSSARADYVVNRQLACCSRQIRYHNVVIDRVERETPSIVDANTREKKGQQLLL